MDAAVNRAGEPQARASPTLRDTTWKSFILHGAQVLQMLGS